MASEPDDGTEIMALNIPNGDGLSPDPSDVTPDLNDLDSSNDNRNSSGPMNSNSSSPVGNNKNLLRFKPKDNASGGYSTIPTKSYSELDGINEHEIIINENDIEGYTDNSTDDDNENKTSGEGWPIFEPISCFYPISVYRKDWKQLKNEIFSGLVVSFAQVPEAVAFSFLAGVDPFIGLHAAWIVGFITSFFGGRCAEISGATGATAAVLAPYMADPDIGVNYLPFIIVLVGVIIMIWGLIGVSKLIALVPHSCMIGFVNGLAVIIATSQLGAFQELNKKYPEKNSEFYSELFWMIGITIITFIIVEFLPRLTKFLPSTLIALLVGTFIEWVIVRLAAGMETVLIGDLGDLAGGLPKIPGIDSYWDLPPINLDTFSKIIVPALTVALVSTVEDLLTIEVVHDLTNTRPRSVKKCELITKLQIIAMGAGNFVCGFFGAIGGGSTIGLSTVNCYSANGRYRWSGVTCSISTFFIVFLASPALANVPAGALVGLMLVVVIHTFEWSSIPIIVVSFLPLKARNYLNDKSFFQKYFNVDRKIHRADAIIIILVTVLTVTTNLGYAIIAGVLFASLVFAWDAKNGLTSSKMTVKRKKNLVFKSKYNGKTDFAKMSNKLDSETDNETDTDLDDINNDEYEIVKIYTLTGPLMFANAHKLPAIFNWNSDPDIIEVHLQNCIVYDYTAINALNNIASKYKKKDKQIHLKYINVKTRKSFDKAKTLIPNFTYDMSVKVDDKQQFAPPTRLNVAHGSRRQL